MIVVGSLFKLTKTSFRDELKFLIDYLRNYLNDFYKSYLIRFLEAWKIFSTPNIYSAIE
jgi:hypothetical protein